MTPKTGRVIAWASFALGIAVSVAGNILHSALTPAGLGELVGAAFWPLALMLSIEILTRVRWQHGAWWMTARVVGLAAVGIVAAVLSYRHLAGLMTSWGEDWFNAHLGPFAVDGLMLLAATALLSISKEAPAVVTEDDDEDGELMSGEEMARLLKEPVTFPEVSARRDANIYGTPVATDVVVTEEPDGSVTATGKPTPEASKLHIVDRVSEGDAVEAARQAFFQAATDTGRPLSAAQVADMLNVSKATAHRKYTSKWNEERRIVR